MPGPLASRLNPGMHGLTEIVYAYASAANGNGSAFAGLAANTCDPATARPVFVSLHLGVILLLGGLSYLPVLVLGPIGESFTT